MKKILFMLLLLIIPSFLTEAIGQIQQIESKKDSSEQRVTGVVKESPTESVPYAHVFFIQNRDTTGIATDDKGYFIYSGKLSDTIRLVVSAVGYEIFSNIYIPRIHGYHFEVMLKKVDIDLDEVSIRGKRHRNMEIFHLNGRFKIDDQDTMFTGVCHRDIKELIDSNYIRIGAIEGSNVKNEIRRCWQFNFTEDNEKEMLELTERIQNLSTLGEEAAVQESKLRIQAIKAHITELESLPDHELKESANARGQSVSEFRKTTIKGLRNLMKLSKKQNRQSYIDQISYWAKIRLSELRNKKKNSLRPENVAIKYELKEKMAQLMVDHQLHNYRETFGWFTHGLGGVARREFHPTWRKEVLAWGFVDHDSREIIPCQYGWVLNNKPRMKSLEETDPILHEIYANDPTPLDRVPIDTLFQTDFPYTDKYGWITVGDFMNPNLMGMVDRDNKVMIPLRFIRREERHEFIEFYETESGDFAPVTIWKNGKLLDGIIDREGNFTLTPEYKTPIFFHKRRGCFYTDSKKGKKEERLYFDANGNEITE